MLPVFIVLPIEIESKSKVLTNLEKISADYKQMKEENKTLMAKYAVWYLEFTFHCLRNMMPYNAYSVYDPLSSMATDPDTTMTNLLAHLLTSFHDLYQQNHELDDPPITIPPINSQQP
ncbi:hypothetical protein KUTeg_024037 [Tegillarca granosa]|uniref:Uncharacterized protein n=1 Tax=Tegillarca granosa TaxID=220873 RepID=A0ABQ9E1C7_TEGGR|nr:hypothetical protein KUTeg_024037 [Tegillarca granosa]